MVIFCFFRATRLGLPFSSTQQEAMLSFTLVSVYVQLLPSLLLTALLDMDILTP